MHYDEELNSLQHTFNVFIILCLLWIPYLAFLVYWMSTDITFFSQLFLIIFIIPAFFQPVFWYLMLGCFLWVIIGMYRKKWEQMLDPKY
ncbi:hypothetical protein BN1356_00919 [Streptococcus varani]|uniref:Uncharacterized protein n=1 Tax=Streptococcus varani TaxID=1608583 RepID=A0A0E4H462_9STRE|nr:hypothetical protein BN1356_00919 [Streptococcus varani]